MVDIKVSVIIPTFNSGKTLERCLASVRANRSKYYYEVIVVDAGSDDCTIEVAKKYADKILNGLPLTVNRNEGVKNAIGDVISFTDSDCIVPENWIDWLVDGLLRLNKQNSKVIGVGGGNIPLLENPSLIELAIAEALRSPLISFRARNVNVYQNEQEVLHNPPMNSAYFEWALKKVGGFQEEYGYGGEDLALDAKLTSNGFKLYYLPQEVVYHAHPSNFKGFIKKMYKLGISRIRVGRQFKQYLQLQHYGVIFLCLMTFSPLVFIPFGMSLVNGAYTSYRRQNLLLFLPLVVLTMSFYVSYGFGEIVGILKGEKA